MAKPKLQTTKDDLLDVLASSDNLFTAVRPFLVGSYRATGGVVIQHKQAERILALLAKRLGIAPIGLHPLIALVQLLRADHVTRDPEGSELSLQSKTEPARFIDRVDRRFRMLRRSFAAQGRNAAPLILCAGLGLLPPSCTTTT